MLGYDPEGERGTSHMMPDKITVHEPKEDRIPEVGDMVVDEPEPRSSEHIAAPEAAPVVQEEQAYGGGGEAYAPENW